MNDYFPSLYNKTTATSAHSFHLTLTNTESDEMHETGMKCARFIKDASAWEKKRAGVWKKKR